MDLTVALNERQRQAVETTEGAVLVLAGAGSGKTRALTYRIAYLIEQGVDPYNILTLTFTNKAAEDMEQKVKKLIGDQISNMYLGTFHSVCVRILSQNLEPLGYESGFVIYDQSETKALVSDIIVTFDLDKEKYDPQSICRIINKAKQNLWTTEELIDYYEDTDFYQNIAEIYVKYNEALQDNNAFDFNDLIGKTIELFEENEEILEKYQERFKYVLIDEYQDTSPVQYQLARMLSRKHNNIFAVGDDYQSIYKFRGADMSNILDFSTDFADCKVIKLERNYRCKANIIEASNAVIEHNYNQSDKQAWTDNEPGEPIVIAEASDEYGEADYIVDEINNLVRFTGYDYSDIAILYRSNHQSRVLEEAFVKQRIPYYIVGGLGFYDRKEIKDIISYLKVAVNPQDTVALKRIVNTPKRGLGPRTIDKLINHAQEHVPEFDLFSFAQEDNTLGLFDVMQEPTQVSGIGKKKAAKVRQFHETLEQLIAVKESDLSLPQQVDQILKKSGYQAMLELDTSENAQTRLENINEFLALTNNYYQKNKSRDLEDFLRDLRLFSDQDDLNEANQVKMMTVHAAKGLEFPVVFVVGVEEEIFPHYRSITTGEREDIEEERRLCYVAMTRAEDRLFMSYARERKKYGETQEMIPSRFLDELPREVVLEKYHDLGF
ncbi:DNA/RNA helicase, superfamily I [Halobacteroides halobius DSM 5150]|uniref:DNA 3'-5' helicase n=1 Tax=Halobacteroides halobius (strain ATCC 35273 / DSM 5150 / MD-1) TaxID=748449 RepID=L0K7Z7_HALHC|nr:UvrD-helicase domain-containing protein [Halobacteroides halobius]AGB41146.1 DNA/RNA helicase, superfamily I [Halobacteroides halobius DSM 5150]